MPLRTCTAKTKILKRRFFPIKKRFFPIKRRFYPYPCFWYNFRDRCGKFAGELSAYINDERKETKHGVYLTCVANGLALRTGFALLIRRMVQPFGA